MTPILQTLIDARAILNDPAKWVQHVMAKDARGNWLASSPSWLHAEVVKSNDAVCFCADGALLRAAPDEATYIHAGIALTDQLKRDHYGDNTHIWFNDFASRSHADVLGLFDRTIEHARTTQKAQ